jgi:hypothetical protein
MIAENLQKPAVLHLTCPKAGATIDKIDFASFGTPTGNCASGFKTGSCDSNKTMAVVTKACVGKGSCSIDVSDGNFGDPCFKTAKTLAVKVSCAGGSTPSAKKVLSYAVTIPVGAAATVRLPGFGGTAAGVAVSESGKSVFSNGAFTPSAVPGVSAGTFNEALMAVELTVGSGSFNFDVSADVTA